MFIKLDRYTGTQLSTDVDNHNIVPFTECVSEIQLTVNGTHYMRWQLPLILPYVAISRATDLEKITLLLPIRPDHFINKHFLAQNIKINEFYNNLNKKFNTDEEI